MEQSQRFLSKKAIYLADSAFAFEESMDIRLAKTSVEVLNGLYFKIYVYEK